MADAKTKLRVVTPNEKPKARRTPVKRARVKRVKTVTEAVAAGDQREQLVAMRTRIAKAIDEPNIRGADLAALSRRLLEIAKEIDAIDARALEDAREHAATPDEQWEAI